MDEHVPGPLAGASVAAAVGPVPAAVGDHVELVDIDVHQLARCFSHIALGLLGGAVAGVEASHALGVPRAISTSNTLPSASAIGPSGNCSPVAIIRGSFISGQ